MHSLCVKAVRPRRSSAERRSPSTHTPIILFPNWPNPAMADPDGTPHPPTSYDATQNGTEPATSTRTRIHQIRNRITQLQEEKELELLLLQLHEQEQELEQLRNRRRSLPSQAARYPTRSPVTRALQSRARSRSPDRVATRAAPTRPGPEPTPAPEPAAPVSVEPASLASDFSSQSPRVKSEPADSDPDFVEQSEPDSNPTRTPDAASGTGGVRPPGEWCRSCILGMVRKPHLCCVVYPGSLCGKCIPCYNKKTVCEPVCPPFRRGIWRSSRLSLMKC